MVINLADYGATLTYTGLANELYILAENNQPAIFDLTGVRHISTVFADALFTELTKNKIVFHVQNAGYISDLIIRGSIAKGENR